MDLFKETSSTGNNFIKILEDSFKKVEEFFNKKNYNYNA